ELGRRPVRVAVHHAPGHGSVRARQLLVDLERLERAEIEAAVIFRHRQAKEPRSREIACEVIRQASTGLDALTVGENARPERPGAIQERHGYAAADFTSPASRSIARIIAGTPARGRSNVIHCAPRPRTRRISDAISSTEPWNAARPLPFAPSVISSRLRGASPGRSRRPWRAARSLTVAKPFSMSSRLSPSGCHASPSSAQRRTAGLETAPGAPPTQIGGCGRCAGRGENVAPL